MACARRGIHCLSYSSRVWHANRPFVLQQPNMGRQAHILSSQAKHGANVSYERLKAPSPCMDLPQGIQLAAVRSRYNQCRHCLPCPCLITSPCPSSKVWPRPSRFVTAHYPPPPYNTFGWARAVCGLRMLVRARSAGARSRTAIAFLTSPGAYVVTLQI